VVDKQPNLITIGRINSVFGVKGWVKVHSDTEPENNIFQYSPWWLKTRFGVKPYECDSFRAHGNGWVAHLEGIDDRDQAELLARAEIAIERDQLPDLQTGEYYWSQLVGLRVVSHFTGAEQDFGVVSKMLETGANDVLVVQGDEQSFDQKERLIPYVPDEFVTSVDTKAGVIRVNWDPEF